MAERLHTGLARSINVVVAKANLINRFSHFADVGGNRLVTSKRMQGDCSVWRSGEIQPCRWLREALIFWSRAIGLEIPIEPRFNIIVLRQKEHSSIILRNIHLCSLVSTGNCI
jgi:hypothetical protein